MLKIKSLKTVVEFTKSIEDIVKDNKCEYIDAVVTYCENNGIEIETVAPLIKQSARLKSSIREEAENINMISKTKKFAVR